MSKETEKKLKKTVHWGTQSADNDQPLSEEDKKTVAAQTDDLIQQTLDDPQKFIIKKEPIRWGRYLLGILLVAAALACAILFGGIAFLLPIALVGFCVGLGRFIWNKKPSIQTPTVPDTAIKERLDDRYDPNHLIKDSIDLIKKKCPNVSISEDQLNTLKRTFIGLLKRTMNVNGKRHSFLSYDKEKISSLTDHIITCIKSTTSSELETQLKELRNDEKISSNEDKREMIAQYFKPVLEQILTPNKHVLEQISKIDNDPEFFKIPYQKGTPSVTNQITPSLDQPNTPFEEAINWRQLENNLRHHLYPATDPMTEDDDTQLWNQVDQCFDAFRAALENACTTSSADSQERWDAVVAPCNTLRDKLQALKVLPSEDDDADRFIKTCKQWFKLKNGGTAYMTYQNPTEKSSMAVSLASNGIFANPNSSITPSDTPVVNNPSRSLGCLIL